MENPINILVADDMAFMRNILMKELRVYGYDNVLEASNGTDALKKFQLNKVHMAMLDINMPNKNGVEVLKEIRSSDSDVFVVMISADNSTDVIKSIIALRANAFVVKPYSTIKIHSIIEKFNQHLLASGLSPAKRTYS